MKPMIWHPEKSDQQVNAYLDKTNREPWVAIYAGILLVISLFTVLVLLGT